MTVLGDTPSTQPASRAVSNTGSRTICTVPSIGSGPAIVHAPAGSLADTEHRRQTIPSVPILPSLGSLDLGRLAPRRLEHRPCGGGRDRLLITIFEGQILDGRNRLEACQLAGVEPKLVEWRGGGSVLEYVVAENLRRRNLTVGQLSAIGVELIPLYEEEARQRRLEGARAAGKASPKIGQPSVPVEDLQAGKSAEKAAQTVGVSRSSVENAKALKTSAPARFEQVKQGTLTLGSAISEVKREETRRGWPAGSANCRAGATIRPARAPQPLCDETMKLRDVARFR